MLNLKKKNNITKYHRLILQQVVIIAETELWRWWQAIKNINPKAEALHPLDGALVSIYSRAAPG